MKVRVIVNRHGGTLKGSGQDGEKRGCATPLPRPASTPISGSTEPDELFDALAEAAKAPGLDALVAGGGDGTLSCAAGHLAGTGRPLGILPLGTLNHLARDAGIPAELEEAAAVIAAGHVREIDLAEVNGRVFVNNSSVGLYPDMVRLREAEQERNGPEQEAGDALREPDHLAPFPPPPALDQRRRAGGADPHAFAVRRQQPLRGEPVRRSASARRSMQGELCLYAIRARSRAGLFWAGIRGIFGKLDQQRDFVTAYVAEAEVSSDRDTMTISADGETVRMEMPLRYRILPKALKLIVPAP